VTVTDLSGAAPGPRVGGAWGIVQRLFVATIAAVALVLAVTASSRSDTRVTVAGGGLCVLVLLGGVRIYRLDRSLLWHVGRTKPWVFLALGLAAVVFADAGKGVIGSTTWPPATELVLVPGYVCVALGVLLPIQGRAPGRALDALVTSAIGVLSVGFPLWTLAFEQRVKHGMPVPTAVTALGVPLLDLLVLFMLARLMLLSEEHPPAYNYLLLAVGTLAAAHGVAAVNVLHGVAQPIQGLGGPLLLGYGLWAAAALHPSMGQLFDPPERIPPRIGAPQLAVLGLVQLLGPALLAVQTARGIKGSIPSVVGGTGLLSALVVVHLTIGLRARARVEHAAHHDELTGLPRRELFNDRLAIAVAAASQRQGSLAIMFIDLDRFKKVNDSLGHAIGDQVLQLVARRLRRCVRDGDVVARMGGDEFTVLLPDIAEEHDAGVVARKVLDAFVEPFNVAGRGLYVTASVGLAVYPSHGSDPQVLLKNADAAMYQAKEDGRNGFRTYTADINANAHVRLDLENDLHHAIARNQLTVLFQPKVRLDSAKVVGVEALVRWQHPQLGLLGPDAFIPLAEESGLIAPLGEWVLETACRQAVTWMNEGFQGLSVAVNLSARQFQLQAMDSVVAAALRRTGLPSHLLEVELTESLALQDNEAVKATLESIHDLGVTCSVDDFGVGFSNFGYLGTLPIDKIKVDKSFVSQLDGANDKSASALIIGMIATAKALGLGVVAEGVENHSQLAFLRERGCDQMQGFLFSAPVPSEQLSALLMLESISPGQGRLGALLVASTPNPTNGRRPRPLRVRRPAG
jgi:diguanylate cyclase (GGDEF)-like protein